MKFKLSKREKAPEIELKSKDLSNIGLSPEERGYLALNLRFGGKFVAEKILQLIRQKATYPFTYLKVRNLNILDEQLVLTSVSKKLGQSAVVITTVLCPSFFETDVNYIFFKCVCFYRTILIHGHWQPY